MSDTKHPSITLRRFNHGLSLVVIILALYILLTPLLPQFGFWFGKRFSSPPPLVAANSNDGPSNNSETIPDRNTLVVPSISLQQEIHENSGSGALRSGIWRRKNTSTPDRGGNTVIVGHRFTYSNPNGEFYHLDKVKTGDKIVVYWDKQKYVYKVDKTFVTPADNLAIEESSDQKMLTLYTCTPLWSAKDRLVVQAKLEETTP